MEKLWKRAGLAAVLACFSVSPVAAQVSNETAGAQLSDAQRLYEQGQYALAAEKYLEFRETLIQLGNERAPIALWNAGLAVEHIPGREREALDLFRRFIADSHSLTEMAEVRDFRSEAQTKIANLEASLGLAAGEGASSGGGDTLVVAGASVLGIGVAIGIAAVPIGLIAVDGGTRIATECPGDVCPPGERSFVEETQAYSIATDVLWVAGLTIAAAGAVILALGMAGSSSDSASVQPLVGCGSDGCMAGLRGTFDGDAR